MEKSLLQQGLQAAQRGDRAQAQRFLQQALGINPRNVKTWLLLSTVVDTKEKKRQCLERVLRIDPGNQAALRGLANLEQQPPPSPAEVPSDQPEKPAPHSLSVAPLEPSFVVQPELFRDILQEIRTIMEKMEGLRQGDPGLSLAEIAKSIRPAERPPIKAALFVDFDNIYIGLKKIDPNAAEIFAKDPARWIEWIEQGMPGFEQAHRQPPSGRELLVRRCYLNPRTFQQFRPYFIRSAFSVRDCPPLTRHGKTSTDIHMVMDILDTLQQQTHLEEFIILSGDADFTPVLLRLRARDFRTTIVAIGPAAEAYKAACDHVIPEDSFIEHALGISPEPSEERKRAKTATVPPEVLDRIAKRVYEEASASGELLATELPDIFKEFAEFRREKTWLGFYSLRALAQEIVRRHADLRLAEGDPWRVVVHTSPSGVVKHDLRAKIVDQVHQIVADAEEAVPMAKAAHEVIQFLGSQVKETRWAGAGTFKNLLQSIEGREYKIDIPPNTSGFLYDPERHQRPSADPRAEDLRGLPADLVNFMRRVSKMTGIPALTPRQYRVVFEAIADDLKERPYNITRTSKSVRDRCIERGEPISRSNVSFALRGIRYTGYRFGEHPEDDTPVNLGEAFRNNALGLIGDAQLELTEEEREMLDRWILGGFSKED